ncbi:chromosome segregation protein SMC [Papillibacter cinnamivorans]|uniref:Chromosome partition protein Smc n=1 Tax=Papillibacter cinnamivorans DSM 12816 TaxID=1122930 RepID=A0A1W1ZE91_9FIRM|nr:chromosome segregation protein SMC [Papillibacter cinnamivorans]SMC46707.1 condensin subunit Smc [Papillibacter cinnamivorans DSM 12816]
MYLKALEIQGFKSFPEKTVLTFGESITAIVGPNGSGKSNIADAICWVMGEQSTRALRGGKMEDVIFGGTQKRSQVGFAEVSLIIDNTEEILPAEGSEVMVTRRYYRSGESEYYINRRSVRLKDINELFMDTGLGREGYSIIGQGRIDEILSVKSEERREVFEEAAGISRFRHKKEEAERKLQHTRDNLLRIGDKISELELQVEPLREQAEKAKRYLVLRDELRSLEVSVWMDQLDKLRSSSIKTLSDFEAAKGQLEEGNRTLEALYAAAEGYSQRMREKDMETENARSRLAAAEAEKAEAERACAILKGEMEHSRENAERISKELSAQAERAAGLSAQTEERKRRLAEIAERKDGIQYRTEELATEAEEALRSSGNIGAEIEALLAKETLEASAAAEGRGKIAALAASDGELEARDRAAAEEETGAKARAQTARSAAEEAARQLKEAREEAASLQNTIGGYRLRLQNREKRAADAGEKKNALSLEQNNIRSRLHLLTEMEKEYEGFSKAVRTVMQEAERGILKNIHGPAANLLRTRDEYTVAVETALGPALQHIVVGREEDGKAAIESLRRKDAGRATFLPLTSVRGGELREEGLAREAGFVGLASSLVEYEKQYEGIIKSLLGRTAVVEDMDRAIAIARKYSHRFRIVTLDGQVLNPGGSMTGGSVNRTAGVLTRANELKRLEERAAETDGRLAAAVKDLEDARRTETAARYELEVATTQLRQLEDRILKLEGNEKQHEVLLTELDRALENLASERGEISRRLEASREAKAALETEAQGHEASAAEYRREAEARLSSRTEMERLGGRLAEEISGLKVESAALAAEESAEEKALGELEALGKELLSDRESRMKTIGEYKEKEQAAKEKAERLETEIGRFLEKAEAERRTIRELGGEKLALEAERVRRERESQDKNREILSMERECARLEQKKTTAALEEKQILDRLWDNYELSHTAAQAARVPLESLPKAGRRIGELKREIASLGSPNLGAIEEFQRINTRYEFLTGQRDDVERARGELESIIASITGEMKRIFSEQFGIINRCFQETFLELFGGGSATLELEDAGDILNCGIEIRVQPPGKALKTISLLSGGEKAFAAIALYFAILKVRPTPFCVMDEIEAALDDVNVVRFARYLRSMADKTQFIMITHRRGTMEEADTLYGVTMQEMGVSRMLTINLNEMARELNIKN